ncbi:MAG: hypothetical protein Terrestrivirus12_7 [Terrestrivirus sp.]|uniref:Uncharacterized protein n=1 Tax=Terrestrivirus sp. TaxID=2487775 RepID=A0A3G4ZQV3_9VIRU|nr:MAG: hypothetical protein Terrestrivirus12_7 [Terrestrivirus sp.]
MDTNINSLFNWKDYVKLNPDINYCKNDDNISEEAEEHWKNIGSIKMRLCNKKQLEVVNEFGNEIVLYIPYYYYLHKNGLLFDNKIITYKGMKPFYYFMKPENIIEKNESRKWITPKERFLIANNDEHVKEFDKRYWLAPPYKQVYKNDIFKYDKPLLIIHNKYNIEWHLLPINFIKESILDKILSRLVDKYQIVYIRPSNKKNILNTKGYSEDSNMITEDLKDFELIKSKYSDKVIIFDDLLEKHDYSYNELKLMIYANCDNYVCTQGGGSHFTTYFFEKMSILHINGDELGCGAYDGWYMAASDNNNKILKISTNEPEFIDNTIQLFR